MIGAVIGGFFIFSVVLGTCATVFQETPEEQRARVQQRQLEREQEARKKQAELNQISSATGVDIRHIECQKLPNICWFHVDGVIDSPHRKARDLVAAYLKTVDPNRQLFLIWSVVEYAKGPQGQDMVRTYSKAQYATYEGVIKEK